MPLVVGWPGGICQLGEGPNGDNKETREELA
jgi:hypothetical protein